ncbi:MAG TPA: DUF4190 domain-containing protein [Chloroflexi bacterium]|nr:DUF4190 domain-containing protein [Chloroflexota bacterium]
MNHPYYQQAPPPYRQEPSTSGTAVASLIFSILGLLQILPFIGCVVGLILGYSARNQIDRSGGYIGGRGMAQAGIILGWLGVAFAVIGICLAILVFAGAITLPFGMALCAELGSF